MFSFNAILALKTSVTLYVAQESLLIQNSGYDKSTSSEHSVQQNLLRCLAWTTRKAKMGVA